MPVPRSVTDVGPGDYVKVGRQWKKILTNTAFNEPRTPREWTVTTVDGCSYSGWEINDYAKDGDPR